MADGDEMVREVYEELRKLANAYLARERPGHTLQPTALVHEVYFRLAKGEQEEGWNGRGHFFGAAARPCCGSWSITHAGEWPPSVEAARTASRRSRCRTATASSAVRNGTYLISDRNDSSNGDFLSVSLALNGGAASGIAGCVATTVGKVDGNFDRNAGFALAADLDLDRSLTCGFAYNGDWLAGIIGVTFHAHVSGVRAQP